MSLYYFLNAEVTYQQGIDYKARTIKIPLYLKILNFYARHFNYLDLVRKITEDSKNDEERVLKIFEWTYTNIKEQPSSLPIMDDHVWHIIVRGYGVHDQYSDVFSTLCNYAGVDAFFTKVLTKDEKQGIILSFVKIEKKWRVFDPYRGIYFKDLNGEMADAKELKNGQYVLKKFDNSSKNNINYSLFFENLPIFENTGLNRSNTQSPLNRLIYKLNEIRK